MLPSPLKIKAQELYFPNTYQSYGVISEHLDNAKRHHERLQEVVEPKRMLYIAGYNQPTVSGITDYRNLEALPSYTLTLAGDGRVPHELGLLQDVPTYYVEERHGDLPSNRSVLGALDALLRTGKTDDLPDQLPVTREIVSQDELRKRLEDEVERDKSELRKMSERLSVQHALRQKSKYSPEERRAEELVVRGRLGHKTDQERKEPVYPPAAHPPAITISLLADGIDRDFDRTIKANGPPPIDAISVGHYIGVRPQFAERAIDRAISAVVAGKRPSEIKDGDLLLTQFTDRGTIRGELGQPFMIPDPRCAERIIVLAGMGVPSRFGAPELSVLARELCWSLGKIGKRHLACVLIGSGTGNLDIPAAVSAWIRGVKNALVGSACAEDRRLSAITICEIEKGRLKKIDAALRTEAARLNVRKPPLVNIQVRSATAPDRFAATSQSVPSTVRSSKQTTEVPTRINVELDERGYYRFGAISNIASIPEREIAVDPQIVLKANDELARAADLPSQFQKGRFLEQFLLPSDLRTHLEGNRPVVMLLDATTARVHWEMLAQPGAGSFDEQQLLKGESIPDLHEFFLAIGRGFTRQLRTIFSPLPEPPPPPRRLMRVLVVADPAPDAHLPGAEEEGVLIADLFESFNTLYGGRADNRIEVKRLFGPREATRVNVLSELMLHSYDVLHFAGHCVYDRTNPALSGLIFSVKDNERLTARELTRIDRIPKFVFANACESGITPDRAELRSPELAPVFAESFFARGVSNFVCAAWPVGDVPAREFALRVYAGLLGLDVGKSKDRHAVAPMEAMHEAMREARLLLATRDYGVRTWGAYQHYGNPYLRFFERTDVFRGKAA
jgi:hypothetical protein